MQMHELKRKTPLKKGVQIGRGGTRGKTAGRGHKGQKAHGGHGMRPQMRDTIKKLPKIRGRGVNLNTGHKVAYAPVNIAKLEATFADGTVVSPKTLLEHGMVNRVNGKLPAVKILGTGETKKAFTIEGCVLSATAKEKIEKAGGTVK